jgi:cytidylate kinase
MISFVCGQLCCGKTTYAKALVSITNGKFVEVGDIVRDIKQTTDRRLLQDSKELWIQIVEKLKQLSEEYCDTDIIICGVRQKQILEKFSNSTLLWIECPIQEREKRYKERNRNGDAIPFQTADNGDVSLGILEVKEYILSSKH